MEGQEWSGVTERMVDEVDESKRKNKVYDLRLEPSGKWSVHRLLVHRFPENSFNHRTQIVKTTYLNCSRHEGTSSSVMSS